MTSSHTVRALSAALLAAALGLAALPGCGGKPAPTQAEKKEEPKVAPKSDGVEPKPADKKDDPKPSPVGTEPKSLLGPVEPAAEQTAEAFLKELGQGTAKADALSANFLKAVGKPLELPGDIAAGVSRDSATRWLERVGKGKAFSLSLDRKQAGDAIYWRGSIQGVPGSSYSLRLVKEGGQWKVDWLSLSSAEGPTVLAVGAPDAAFQQFAAAAFVEALADGSVMEQKDRATALARGMAPALRTAWAPPFDGDTKQGYDFSPTKLAIRATEYGGGTKEFTLSKVGDLPEFKVELNRPGGKKALVVRLVKGATPGEWLVNEVVEAKG